jgi:hypothetical protein
MPSLAAHPVVDVYTSQCTNANLGTEPPPHHAGVRVGMHAKRKLASGKQLSLSLMFVRPVPSSVGARYIAGTYTAVIPKITTNISHASRQKS